MLKKFKFSRVTPSIELFERRGEKRKRKEEMKKMKKRLGPIKKGLRYRHAWKL